MSTEHIDCLVVGGGFAGVHALYRLRQEGYTTKLFEAAPGLGGIWRHACYPGARVDSELPIYGLKFPEVWRTWNWSQRYPDYKEIRRYFDHVDKVLDLNKDCSFNTPVNKATWNAQTSRWDIVAGKDGETKLSCQYLVLCMGFASRINWPDIPNREAYKGQLYHSGTWPDGLEPEHLAGKNIAVVGSGASGVQCTQELGKHAKNMTVFIRTPNLTLPMHNPKVTAEEQDLYRDNYDVIFEKRNRTFAGFSYDMNPTPWTDHTPEEREAFYETIWNRGGFHYWLETYDKAYSDKDCNETMYKFWLKKTAPQIKDPKKRAILAPEKQPHTFGTVRPSLQVSYYDVMNQDNVEVVHVKDNPIRSFTSTGFELTDGTKRDFDVIVLATGYDTHTGGFKQIDISGLDGYPLAKHWEQGCKSYLGLGTSRFPNMFFTYGPHGPTAYSNGPSTTDIQTDWLCEFLQYLKDSKVKSVVPESEPEEVFCKRIWDLSAETLFHSSHGWYMGRNVKGKPAQPLNYTGGIPKYIGDLTDCSKNDYKGWKMER